MVGRLPYHPVNQLKPLAADLWMVDGACVHMRVIGPISLPFTTRMIVVRMPEASGGGLWLHSPVEPTPALLAAVAGLGRPRWLIAPNRIHYAHVQAWLDAFPKARVWGTRGVMDRARANAIPLTVHHELGADPPADWADVMDQALVTSRFMQEAAFFHRPSRTAILTDLIENIDPARVGPFLRFGTWLGGTKGPDGGTPRDWRASFPRGDAANRAAFARIIGWQPVRVTFAHGDIYTTRAATRLARALAWGTEEPA